MTCCSCSSCPEYQNKPAKPTIHRWMLPEKPWSCLHLDHANSFMGSNWLVLMDAYLKYPCIYHTQSVSSKATIELLEQDFAYCGSHAHNGQCFMFPQRGVPDLVQGGKHHSYDRSTIPSSYQWGCRVPYSDL